MVTPTAERFAEALAAGAGGRARVLLSEAWSAFAAVHGAHFPGDRRREMRSLIEAAAAAGRLRFPADRRDAWDRAAVPALPVFVTLRRSAEEPAKAAEEPHPWAAELSFLADRRGLVGRAEWLAVDAWLKAGGRSAQPVPVRERSWEVLRDEKALDAFLQRKPFTDGRLDGHALLRCHDTPEPMSAAVCGAAGGESLLVVENTAAFHSLAAWNATHARWSAVAYGRGNSFRSGWQGLPDLCRSMGTATAEYVGDIDGAGVAIPFGCVEALARSGVSLVACRWLYAGMLECGGGGVPAPGGMWNPGAAATWLPNGVRDGVLALAAAGRRIPQEAFGTLNLAQLGLGRPPD